MQIKHDETTEIGRSGLCVRTKNCLHRAGIHTFEELTKHPLSKLMSLAGFGAKCAHELRNELQQRGLKLAPERDHVVGFHDLLGMHRDLERRFDALERKVLGPAI